MTVLAAATASSIEGAQSPIVQAVVPSNGQITITEYGFRDWGPELVNYTIDKSKFKGTKFVLTDPQGKNVPFQIDKTLSFVASLPKGATSTYTFAPSDKDHSADNSTMTYKLLDDHLEFGNEFITLRVPVPAKKTFSPAKNAADVPTPLLAWKHTGQNWIGRGLFKTSSTVTSTSFTVVRQGPACVEYEARYTFAPAGEYVCRVRLSPSMPVAIVTDEFDMGKISNGEDMLVYDISSGWQPRIFSWARDGGEMRPPIVKTDTFADFLDWRFRTPHQPASVGGVGPEPLSLPPGPGARLVEKMIPGGKWGGYVGGFILTDGTKEAPAADSAFGVATLSAGSWRRSMAIDSWYHESTGVQITLPISVRRCRWSMEVTDDFSPFSSHEHDSDLKETYGRRVWGLYAALDIHRAQARFGYIGLDAYKDWIVDYPEGPHEHFSSYPGNLYAKDLFDPLKNWVDHFPDTTLKTFGLTTGRGDQSLVNAKSVIARLKVPPYIENDFFVGGLTHYRKGQMLMFANRAEDALSFEYLPQDVRHELRCYLALYANLVSNPDFNPRGAGVHLGNNNMTINRTLALSLFAAQLPDHPLHSYWLDQIKAFAEYKLRSEVGPEGVNIETPTYQLYAPAQVENIAINLLSNNKRDVTDLLGPYKKTLTFLAHLTMADPRYPDGRIVPGMGNSGNSFQSIWGTSIATFLHHDQKFAEWLRYFYRISGEHIGAEFTATSCVGLAPYFLPWVKENPVPLTTTFFPSYGVAFHNRFAQKNETGILFRSGMNWGHWDTDANNVILYAKDAPLSPGTKYQYYSGAVNANEAIYHNQVKIGGRNIQECFGRVDNYVSDYGFGQNTDYAVGSRYYPSQIFKDNDSAMTWNRHMMFVKSGLADGSDYLVMRDTFHGGTSRKTWWEWMNLDGAEMISVNGKAFDPAKTPFDKVIPDDQFPTINGQHVEMKTKYGASSHFYFSEPREVCTRMTFIAAGETKTVVVVRGAPKQDYFYCIWPKRDNQSVPAFKTLGAGVMEIDGPESKDIVFLGDSPFDWNSNDVVFSGKAGVVRLFADRVVFCMNAGSGSIGYKGYIVKGHGPFEHTVLLKNLAAGTHQITGGYKKESVTIDIEEGVTLSGEGPFTASLKDRVITIQTKGRAKVLHLTTPKWIVKPQYFIDGKEWMPSYTDQANNGWGSYDQTWLIGLPVPEGEHTLTVQDRVYPKVWARQFTPLIKDVVIRK